MKTAKDVERVAGECTTAIASLKVREEQLQAKEMKCKVFWLNLIKEKERREEEELRTEGLQRKLATMKIERMELQERIVAQIEAHNEEMQRANELTGSLAEQTKKHKA